MKVNHGINTNKWLKHQKKTLKKQDTSKTTTNLKNTFYEDKEIQDIMKEFYQIKKSNNLTQFLEDYNRYEVQICSVNKTFDDLSNDVSHFVLAQIFIIPTCLRYVDILGFCQFSQIL